MIALSIAFSFVAVGLSLVALSSHPVCVRWFHERKMRMRFRDYPDPFTRQGKEDTEDVWVPQYLREGGRVDFVKFGISRRNVGK